MNYDLVERDIVVVNVEVAAVERNVLQIVNVRQSVVVSRAGYERHTALVDHFVALDEVIDSLLSGGVSGNVSGVVAVKHICAFSNGHRCDAVLLAA